MIRLFLISAVIFIHAFSLQSCNGNRAKTPSELFKDVSKDGDINTGNLNFNFSLPQGWYRIDTVIQNIQITFLLNNDKEFAPTINILTESMHGKDHSTYIKGTKEYLKNNMNDINILENGDFKTEEYNCIWYTYNRKQNDIPREMIFYSIIVNDISYNITAGFNKGGRKKYQKIVDEITKSFTLN